MLQLVHVQCSGLVDDLKVYELPNVSIRTSFEGSDLRRTLTGAVNTGAGASSAVSTMLETAMDELFVQYIDGQRYVEREGKSLQQLYSSLTSTFTRYHVSSYFGQCSANNSFTT
jgi:exocyst complex component 5